jgi:hypothetical protein
MSARGCFDRAKDEDEKDERRAESQAKYRTKAKLAVETLLNEKITFMSSVIWSTFPSKWIYTDFK